jgi:hypothetical protein
VQAQAAPPVSCQDLRDQGLPVSLSDHDLTGGDETGFCLVARPEEDTFTAYLPNVATAEGFRTAKARYAKAMMDANYDVCRVGSWRPLNREGGPQINLRAADRLDVPAVCAPRIVARDPDAVSWVDQVSALLTPIADRSADDLGFTPHRPLTVDLYTSPSAAVEAVRAARPDLAPDAAAQLVRDARSLTVLSPTRGVFILLNLTPNPDPDIVRRRLAHEYTHVMQSASAGTLDAFPMWFLEGQAEFQMDRLAGATTNRRADAARRERDGTAPRLTSLVTPADWATAEARDSIAVYGRGAAAVAFLTDRWGYGASARLMKSASDADPSSFDRTFAEITGMDLPAFDQALTAWLLSQGGRVTFVNDSPLEMQLALTDGRTLDLPACTTCTFHHSDDACTTTGRPSAGIDLSPGEYGFLRVVPSDTRRYPHTAIRVRIDSGASITQCLDLPV